MSCFAGGGHPRKGRRLSALQHLRERELCFRCRRRGDMKGARSGVSVGRMESAEDACARSGWARSGKGLHILPALCAALC